MEGLLLCELNITVQDMIRNLAQMVQWCASAIATSFTRSHITILPIRYGLVPNGGRLYYTRWSQPPLLTQMVVLYYQKTGDWDFVQQVLPVLDREYQFWVENRTVADALCDGCKLNQYAAVTTEPRQATTPFIMVK